MKYFFLLLVVSIPANAASWAVSEGSASYTVTHLFKTVHGTSREIKGMIKCEKKCEALIAAPLASFSSGNPSRDTHMQETMKAAEFPIVEVRGNSLDLKPGKHTETATVKIANKKHDYQLETTIEKADKRLKLTSKIPFKLSDFDLERPSLLGAAIDDLVPVDVELSLTEK